MHTTIKPKFLVQTCSVGMARDGVSWAYCINEHLLHMENTPKYFLNSFLGGTGFSCHWTPITRHCNSFSWRKQSFSGIQYFSSWTQWKPVHSPSLVICIFTASEVSCVLIGSFISNHPLSFTYDDSMLFTQVKSNFSCMYLVPRSICLSC